jgi:hypothetical protein
VRELLLIDRPAFTDRDQFAVLLPVRLEGSATKAFAIFVTLSSDPNAPDHSRAFTRCLADLSEALAQAKAATRPFREEEDNPEWPGLLSALDAMSRPGASRQAILFLASRTNVEVLEDVALLGDDAFRGELAQKVVARLGTPVKPTSKENLAWVLENATFALLGEQSSAGKLPAELAAVLAVRAGEAGRHPGALDEGLKTSTNRKEFALRLIAENYIYLEDSSPASRVRAYDWLVARDRAPAGYDPLGPPRDRRAALERALNPPPTTSPAIQPAPRTTSGGAP